MPRCDLSCTWQKGRKGCICYKNISTANKTHGIWITYFTVYNFHRLNNRLYHPLHINIIAINTWTLYLLSHYKTWMSFPLQYIYYFAPLTPASWHIPSSPAGFHGRQQSWGILAWRSVYCPGKRCTLSSGWGVDSRSHTLAHACRKNKLLSHLCPRMQTALSICTGRTRPSLRCQQTLKKETKDVWAKRTDHNGFLSYFTWVFHLNCTGYISTQRVWKQLQQNDNAWIALVVVIKLIYLQLQSTGGSWLEPQFYGSPLLHIHWKLAVKLPWFHAWLDLNHLVWHMDHTDRDLARFRMVLALDKVIHSHLQVAPQFGLRKP